jgi:hypothetical protein
MRRWLAVLLLVLLPIQFSWAAVGDDCMHEPSMAADHAGHHDHAAHGHGAAEKAAGDKAKADASSSAAADFDCSHCHCHGHCVGMIDALAGAEPAACGSAPPTLGPVPRAGHVPAQPERPQWARLA